MEYGPFADPNNVFFIAFGALVFTALGLVGIVQAACEWIGKRRARK